MKKRLATCSLSLFLLLYNAGLTKAVSVLHKAVNHSYKKKNLKQARINGNEGFFRLNVKADDKIGNIFSRTISYKGDGFPEVTFRAGGTGIYTVIDDNPDRPVFDGVFRYDGRPESKYRIEVTNHGQMFSYNGKPGVNTDASGVIFNSLIWGEPPSNLKKGDSWKVAIPQPWELGGAGTQTVTVINIDKKNNTITLKREGSSEGFYDNDAHQISITKDAKVLKMNVTPGTSHWIGYTVFQNGLVKSDELMVTRNVTLTLDELKYEAFEREYILLNAMPV